MTGDALPERPMISGLFHAVPLDPDRVLIANAGRSVVLSGDGFTRRVLPLLGALDGTADLDDLRSRFPDLVPAVVSQLAARGMVVEAAPAPAAAGTAPSLGAAGFPGGPGPAQAQPRLASAAVVVAGCGPVGSTVAVLLAKVGVGRLVLADGRATSSSDVALTPTLPLSAARRRRAEAGARAVATATAAMAEEAALPPAPEILETADLVVVSLGYGDVGPAEAAGTCLERGVPYLVCSQDALEATVGPLVSGPRAPCHECMLVRRLSHLRHLDENLAYRAHRAAAAPGPDAFLAAHCSLVAGLVATEAVGFLLGAPREEGRMTVVDLSSMLVSREEVLAVPRCPACARRPGVAAADG